METQVPESFPGRPPAYREGYVEGCRSGNAVATGSSSKLKRDEQRFQSDSSYANGWSDGYENCRDGHQDSSTELRRDASHPIRGAGGA